MRDPPHLPADEEPPEEFWPRGVTWGGMLEHVAETQCPDCAELVAAVVEEHRTGTLDGENHSLASFPGVTG